MSDFRSMFRYLREREGYSQADLARKLNVSSSTISMWECGNREPEIETLEIIADFFNVDMDFLLGREIRPPASERPQLQQQLIDLIAKIPEEDQEMVAGMVEAALRSRGLL